MKTIEIFFPRDWSVSQANVWLREYGFPPNCLTTIVGHEAGLNGHTFVFIVNKATLIAVQALCTGENKVYIGDKLTDGPYAQYHHCFAGL
jgi:hypothetical protein